MVSRANRYGMEHPGFFPLIRSHAAQPLCSFAASSRGFRIIDTPEHISYTGPPKKGVAPEDVSASCRGYLNPNIEEVTDEINPDEP